MSWFQAAKAVWEVMKPTELNQGEQEWIDQQQRDRDMQDQQNQHDQHVQDHYDHGTSHDTGSSGGDTGE